MNSILLVAFIGLLAKEVVGHGYMIDPPNRSSLYRIDPSAVPNYNDNGVFCGGTTVQNQRNGGKCGLCGDPYSDPHPQDNENTGKYGNGKVVAQYRSGGTIDVHIQMVANHLGNFTYSVCALPDAHRPEPGEDCFIPLKFEDGSDVYHVKESESFIVNKVRLPNIQCDRCVFRWHYHAGNVWGDCGDGHSALGCGPQETYRNCADVSIH